MIEVQKDVDLHYLNTLALRSHCSHYVNISTADQIPEAVTYAQQNGLNIFILSGGSNLLLPQALNVLTLHMQNLGKEVLEDQDDHVILKVQAGEIWHDFVCDCTTKGYYGLENLALIPGKVGAAPIQNIGAYGVEAGDFIEQIWAYDLVSSKDIVFSAADCNFGYRESIFKQHAGRYVLYAVSFKLSKTPQMKLNYADVAQRVGEYPTPQKLLETIIDIRQNKLPQPSEYPNAGSFFKNPVISAEQFKVFHQQYPLAPYYLQEGGQVKVAAGWLIDEAGWKGKKLGVVGMFEKQALVLVNYQDASLEDVKKTYHTVQDDIFRKFAISLEPEPVLLDDKGQVQSHRRVF